MQLSDPMPELIQASNLEEFERWLEVARALSTTPIGIKIDMAAVKRMFADTSPSRAAPKTSKTDVAAPKFATIPKYIVRRFDADVKNLTVRFHYDGLALQVLQVEKPTMEAIRATLGAREVIERCMESRP